MALLEQAVLYFYAFCMTVLIVFCISVGFCFQYMFKTISLPYFYILVIVKKYTIFAFKHILIIYIYITVLMTIYFSFSHIMNNFRIIPIGYFLFPFHTFYSFFI